MTLVVVTGVGTEIGKTHVTCALTLAWSREEPVFAYKPVESGVAGATGADEAALAAYSTFHVKHALLQTRLGDAVSPHLAARREGVPIDIPRIVEAVVAVRRSTSLLVELPGGLFSPLSDTELNADLAARLEADVMLLVAPNRLGVLHDVRAVVEACRARKLPLDGVVLVDGITADAASSTNGAELDRVSGVPVLATVPRGTVEELAASDPFRALVGYCRSRVLGDAPQPTPLE